jgi:hypothetical protein
MTANNPILHGLLLASALTGCGEPSEPSDNEPQALEQCNDPKALCTWAGTGEAGHDGDGNPLRESMLYWPIDVTFTSDEQAYLLDWNNHAVRHVTRKGTLETVIGTGFVGDGPDDLTDRSEPGADDTTVHLNHPTQLVEVADGKLWLVAWHNHKIREFDPDTGRVVIRCGGPAGFGGDGEPFRGAQLNQPTQIVVDEDQSTFILDMRNQLIRKVDPEGIIDTVAGTLQTTGYDGDGGSPTQCTFDFPAGSNPPPGGALALDRQGRLYVSDTLNHVVRRIDFDADLIETVAGTGEAGFGGDGGPGTEAQLDNPRDLQLSRNGKILYIADEFNNRIRALDLDSGELATIAGTGERGYDGEGHAPDETALARPGGLALDADGFLYIADTYNHRVRRFKP